MSELRKISRKIGYAVILEKKFSASECLQEIEEAARDFCCIEKGNFRNKLFFAFEVAKDAVNFYIFVKTFFIQF